MARPPILTLSDIHLGFGGDPLLDGLDLSIQRSDRIALVGRNGSGKSTLMKIIAGRVQPDSGTRFLTPGVAVGYMEQDPDFTGFSTLGDFAVAGLPDGEDYRVEIAAEGLQLQVSLDPKAASGGERRRAALVRLLAQAPDLMLLDEPTNHLDIAAISWLQEHLASTRAAFVLISHDRAFLRALTRATLWVDRGVVRRQDKGFDAFEDWRDRVFEEEELQRHKLNRLIKSEARWAVEGISARRKRNQGRVRRLAALRAERAGQIARVGVAGLAVSSGPKSGRLVVDARDIAKDYGGKPVLRPFSIRVMRGERLALVGPNGAGKTTLLNMLTGALAPDRGDIRLGAGLLPVVFDQNREALDPDATLWETLCGDAELGVSGRNDQVMVRGTPRHVVGYLKDFLFDESQARGPVRALSGGERARLLLAKLLARPSNLLVLDEPTNDLDVETLDLLQEVLDGYEGTVFLVSHDRDFLDRVATTTVAMEGDGRAVIYAGGWSDYQAQKAAHTAQTRPVQTAKKEPPVKRDHGRSGTRAAAKPKGQGRRTGLSYIEQRRLQGLPDEMARLEAEIARLESFLATPDLFATAPEKFAKASAALSERQQALSAAEDCWLELAERAEE